MSLARIIQRLSLCGPFERSRFDGGVRLNGQKQASLRTPIASMPLPTHLQVPIRQHIGTDNRLCVAPGERVKKGQVLALAQAAPSASVHAPTSGHIVSIRDLPVPHPLGLHSTCVVIESDGLDAWEELSTKVDYRTLERDEIVAQLEARGVVGLGGALFPTSTKLARSTRDVDTLIVNAAECEPYITADQALMAERADQIVHGIDIMRYALGAKMTLIGIEDNKPEAIAALRAALPIESDTQLCVLPTVYPIGGERQLIQQLLNREVPSSGLPTDIGVCVVNIATAYAVHRAISHAEPLLSRVVTVTGNGVRQPRNLDVRIGTSIADVIDHCGGYCGEPIQILMGGPMMGFSLPNDQLPVVKSTNCLLVSLCREDRRQIPERPCIRCGFCVQACPARLLPQQLHWYAKARDLGKLQDYNVADCIECGACDYICPSRIPLTDYFRYAKSELAEEQRNREKSAIARQRFEARQARLAAIERKKAEKMANKRAALEASKKAKRDRTFPSSDKAAQDMIAAALMRVQAKKLQAQQAVDLPSRAEHSGDTSIPKRADKDAF